MVKQLTFKEIEKDIALMRSLVNRRVKEYPKNKELIELKRLFDQTFKAARSVINAPYSDFGNTPDRKRAKLMELYSELIGWAEGSFEIWSRLEMEQIDEMRKMKKETEIKTEKSPSVPEMKKVTVIKKDELPKKQEMKKETEIKEGQMKMDLRGGARPGAGRKLIGKRKPVKITLAPESWEEIDNLIQSGHFPSYAEYFRWLFDNRPKNDM